MRARKTFTLGTWLGAALLSLVVAAATPALSAEYWLVAKPLTKTMPDLVAVDMWGFAVDADSNLATDGGELANAPGPILVVPAGENLTIHLRNDLSEPVSLVIPGQVAALNPTWVAGGAVVATGSRPALDVTSRARSFQAETAAAGGLGDYTWTGLRPGTYLYLSGSHPAVQVPMGLYGAVKVFAAGGAAYTGVATDNDAVLLYSEVDPAFNESVSAGCFFSGGAPDPLPVGCTGLARTSAIDFDPKYFLVNGAPYPDAAAVLDHAIATHERVLVRFLNAGVAGHVPSLAKGWFSVIAEDGFLYPYAREQYSTLLAAGKTIDAVFTPGEAGVYAVFDRSLALTNNTAPGGGQLVHLTVADPAGAPTALDDGYVVAEDGASAEPAPGVLGNDSDPDVGDTLTAQLVSTTASGALTLNPDGSFTYTPNPNFSGSDVFTYVAVDPGALQSNVATVSITVTPSNDAPIAVADAYNADEDTHFHVMAPGVLENDGDVDGDSLTAVLVSGPLHGSLTLNADGSFGYMPAMGYTGPDSFTYLANDGVANSAAATVNINVVPKPNTPPTANNDFATTRKNVAVTINILANDTDSDGSIDPATVTIVTNPKYGTAVVNNGTLPGRPLGTVTYTPKTNFRGTDNFAYTVRDNRGATSNNANCRINVTR